MASLYLTFCKKLTTNCLEITFLGSPTQVILPRNAIVYNNGDSQISKQQWDQLYGKPYIWARKFKSFYGTDLNYVFCTYFGNAA